MQSLPAGVDWGLINLAAIEWTTTYTFNLIQGLNETNQAIVRKALQRYYAESMTIGDLEARLTSAFGPVRAEMIAVTEVTRAAAQGEIAVVDELRKQGLDLVAIWQTNRDALVCPICGPRHGKEQGDGWNEPPPAHPRCRCWINHEIRP